MKTYQKKTWSRKQKIFLTIITLLVVQAFAGIPTPGVNPDYFKELISGNSAIGLFNLLAGNGLQNISLTMLSVTPYITGSIIVQLMANVVPYLADLQKEGDYGKKIFHRITLIAGAALAVVEAVGFAVGFGRQGLLVSFTWPWILLTVILWTAGALLCVGAGELIEKKGFGNGISLILLCNIVSSYPSDMYTVYQRFISGKKLNVAIIAGILIAVVILALFLFTVFVQKTERKVPVVYSNKLQGKISAQKSTFPIKLCPGSVVPIIFASSIMSMPALIVAMFGKSFWVTDMLDSSHWFDGTHPLYSIGVPIYLLLIIGFSYFYTDMILNPVEIANNFKKTGATIPGVRPGQPTVEYMKTQIHATVGLGALACCLIALVPCVLSGVFGLSRLSFAGTSILITVGVILETRDKFRSESQASQLTLFGKKPMKKGKR